MKARPKGTQRGKSKSKSKNNPYTDTQDYDSVLVCKDARLTKTGKIFKEHLRKVIQRLEVVKLIEERNKQNNVTEETEAPVLRVSL
jgi:hypothetical protein